MSALLSFSTLGAALSLWLVASALHPAQAQTAREPDYPTKPVHLVVTFPPGGSSDAVVRILAPKLAERLGQPVLIENKAGAGGNIGLAAVAQSAADGYTLGVGAAGGLAANVSLYPKLPYNPAKDFTAITLLAHIPFVLVSGSAAGAKDLAEVIARSKADPGQLTVGHGGNGTAMHLSLQLLQQLAKVRLTEIVYRGSGPATLDVVGGQVALAMVDLPSALPHIKSGKLKALAVTGATRSVFLPDVLTFAQAGVPGYESTGWFGVVAPAATPPAVLKRLQTEFATVLADRFARDPLRTASRSRR